MFKFKTFLRGLAFVEFPSPYEVNFSKIVWVDDNYRFTAVIARIKYPSPYGAGSSKLLGPNAKLDLDVAEFPSLYRVTSSKPYPLQSRRGAGIFASLRRGFFSYP